MAGKSNKAKNKGKPTNSTPNSADSHLKPQDSAVSSDDSAVVTESTSGDANEVGESQSLSTNGTVEVKEENGNDAAGDTSAEITKTAEGLISFLHLIQCDDGTCSLHLSFIGFRIDAYD